jgi:general secretion pathway protein G
MSMALANRRRGFTLIELLVTVVIVGILATALIPLSQLSNQRAKERELREALRQIRSGIDAYKLAGDEGRIMRKAGESGYPPNLEVLVEGVVDARSPKREMIYFLRRIPRDPFYPDGSASASKTWGLRSYASSYERPKPGADVFDVYSTSTETALDGSQYREW